MLQYRRGHERDCSGELKLNFRNTDILTMHAVVRSCWPATVAWNWYFGGLSTRLGRESGAGDQRGEGSSIRSTAVCLCPAEAGRRVLEQLLPSGLIPVGIEPFYIHGERPGLNPIGALLDPDSSFPDVGYGFLCNLLMEGKFA